MALLHAILRARKKHEIYTHFDDEAEEMKKYCGLAIRRFHRQANLGWRERLSIEKKVGGSAIRQFHRQGDLG